MADAKTVLILGAGAVRAAAGRRAVAKTPPLDCDFFDIAKKTHATLHAQVERQLRKLVGTYADEILRSLEETTTLLYLKAVDSTRGSAAHLAFLRQLNLLHRVLKTTTDPLPTGPRSLLYRLFRHELLRLDQPEHLTIITFNYDLMVERALDELQAHNTNTVFSYPSCYQLPTGTKMANVRGGKPFSATGVPHAGVSVLKLHGSLNWQSTHNSREPTPAALFNPRRSLTVLNSSEVAESLTWKQGARTVHMKPVILPPVTGKRGLLHQSLAPVWTAAGTALSEADRLVIFGYSCPPLDFEAKMLLGERVQPTQLKELIVIDPAPAVAGRFIPLCGVGSAQLFSSLDDFLK